MKLNFSIRTKLFMITMFVILVIIGIGVVSYYYIDKVRQYSSSNLPVEELATHIVELSAAEKAFISDAKTNRDFYITGQSKYLTQVQDYYTLSSELFLYLKNSGKFNTEESSTSLVTIQANLLRYQENLDKISKGIRERGYEGYGSIGNLKRKLLEISTGLSDLPGGQANTILQNVRILENEFLLESTDDVKDRMLAELDLLKRTVQLSNNTDALIVSDTSQLRRISPSQARAVNVLTNIEQYRDIVKKIYAVNITLGFSQGASQTLFQQSEEILTVVRENIEVLHQQVREQNRQTISSAVVRLVLAILFLTAIISLLLFLTSNQIAQIFDKFRNYILQLGRGQLPGEFDADSNDELKEIAEAINHLTLNLRNTKEFVTQVGQGNLETEVNVFGNQGELGEALVKMREELLVISRDREKQEREEEKQNWATNGLALFNDILRRNTDNVEGLAFEVTKALVDYLGANQGAIFIVNDEEKETFLELKAAYAYNKKRYKVKKVGFGEGLVGRCAIEKAPIYITDIPDGHFDITSGLGQSSPKCLLVVPLKLNEDIFGIMEIASFNTVERFQIDFAEKVTEAVASSIANVKINIRTAKLLEETRLQAEELASKEEEMRQNMEELQATQEEAARKEAEASSFVNAVDSSIIRADFNTDGMLSYANQKFTEIFDYKDDELKNLHITSLVEQKRLDDFKSKWERILSGGKHIEEEMRMATKSGHIWLLTALTALRNIDEDIRSVLFLGIDIEEQKTKNLDFEGELNAIERSIIKAEFKPDGSFINANDLFLSTLGYTKDDVKDKNAFSFLTKDELFKFEGIWKKVVQGMPYEGLMARQTKGDKERWFRGTYTAVSDFDGEVYKVVYIAYDITKQRKIELASKEQSEQLKIKEEELHETIQKMEEVQRRIAEKEAEIRSQFNAIDQNNVLIEFDKQGTILRANNLFCELFGYLESDVKGRHHRILLSPEDRKKEDYQELWENLKKGERHDGEFKTLSRDNTEIYIKGVYSPILDPDGNVQKVLLVALDITERKIKEAQLQGQLEAINRTNALVEYRLDGTIVSVNKIFCDMLDYTEDELKGRNHSILISPQYKETRAYREFWANLRNAFHEEGEFELVNKEGETVFIQSVYYPMLDTENRPYMIIQLAFDITKSKTLQENLKQHAEELSSQEEELRQNLEELAATQEEMLRQRVQLQESNGKLMSNEAVLKKAIQKSKERELELESKTNELTSSEEELRQNLEEMMTVQEDLFRKQEEILGMNEVMSANEEKLKTVIEESKKKEVELAAKNKILKQQEDLRRDDLEMLQAMQEEMTREQKESKRIRAELEAALKIAEGKEAELKQQNELNTKRALSFREKLDKLDTEMEAKNATIKALEHKVAELLSKLDGK